MRAERMGRQMATETATVVGRLHPKSSLACFDPGVRPSTAMFALSNSRNEQEADFIGVGFAARGYTRRRYTVADVRHPVADCRNGCRRTRATKRGCVNRDLRKVRRS
jgi:hypothetical protein